jgi:hypothetical protein
MAHLTDEEWRGVMGMVTTNAPTMYGQAFMAYKSWNPQWVLGRVQSDSLFTIDEMMRCFMEAYLQGVEKKLGG